MDLYQSGKDFAWAQWEKMTWRHILYLFIFSVILSHILEYILKVKQIRWLYYGLFIVLMIKLVEGDHPVAAGETFYKLLLI